MFFYFAFPVYNGLLLRRFLISNSVNLAFFWNNCLLFSFLAGLFTNKSNVCNFLKKFHFSDMNFTHFFRKFNKIVNVRYCHANNWTFETHLCGQLRREHIGQKVWSKLTYYKTEFHLCKHFCLLWFKNETTKYEHNIGDRVHTK